MCHCLHQLIILSSLLRIFNGIEYSQIINATEPEQFVQLSAADFETVEEFENIDIKQVIMDELTKNGEQLTPSFVRFLDNPTGESDQLEGDIDLPPDTNIALTDPNQWNLAYSAVADNRKLWPNGIIPYLISSYYGRFARGQIAKAINHFDKKKTCLNYVERTNETDYLVIRPQIGCQSHVGRMGGRQVVSISAGCTEYVTVVHELMHAAGFYHKQARYDRDNHVNIHLANVEPKPGIIKQFDKQNESVISLLGMPYDQHSIMHYKEYAFSISPHRLRTISAKNGGQLSNNYGLTDVDVMKINILYDCANKSDDAALTKNAGKLAAAVRSGHLHPKNYYDYNNGARFYMSTEKSNWQRAAENCRAFGGDIASINNEATDNKIYELIKSISYTNRNVWIGLSDIATEGTWVCSSWTNWHRWEPSDDRSCAVFYSGHGTWQTRDCSNSYYFLCQENQEIQAIT